MAGKTLRELRIMAKELGVVYDKALSKEDLEEAIVMAQLKKEGEARPPGKTYQFLDQFNVPEIGIVPKEEPVFTIDLVTRLRNNIDHVKVALDQLAQTIKMFELAS